MKLNILNQKKLLKYSELTSIPLEEWQKEEKLSTYERILEDIFSIFPVSSKEEILIYRKEKRFVMLECLAEVKRVIYKIRSGYLKQNIQKPKSFLTSDRVSISTEKDLKKLWILRTKENSKKLWLPTKTDSVVSDLNLSNISLKHKAMLKSWFSVRTVLPKNQNLPPTCYPSSLSLVPECTVLENTKNKSKKTKVYFKKEFKPKLKQMIGSYRYFYNQGISYLNSLERGFYKPKKNSKKKADYIKYEGEYFKVETNGKYAYGVIPSYDNEGNQLSLTGFQTIRNYLKNNKPEWFTSLPIHLIDQAARECASNFLSIIKKRKNDNKKFRMKFKSKHKSVTETINMEKSSLNKDGKIYISKFKGIDTKVYIKEPLDIKNNKHEYKIIYDRNTYEYYISLLVKNNNYKNKNGDKWCSIDPGEKIFATMYNSYDKEILFLGHNERNSFNDLTIDKLQRSISIKKTKGKIRALQKARNKDKNKRQEMHHKIANYLCSNFKHIIVPDYGIKNMRLHSTVNRSMRNLGFYQFLTFLKHKCVERNVKLYIVNESYTSQACCNCGCLNKPNDRDYTCKECKQEIHRDVNGSINIALKHLQSK